MDNKQRSARRVRLSASVACTLLAAAAVRGAHTSPAGAPVPALALTDSRDFVHLWWAYGLRGRSPEGRRLLCVRTGWYGLAMDIERMDFARLGAMHRSTYEATVSEPNEPVLALPEAHVRAAVEVDGVIYRCIGAARDTRDWITYPIRMVETGRSLARFDVQQLEFADKQGRRLDVEGRLEVIAWPDRIALMLEVVPGSLLSKARVTLSAEGADPVSSPAPSAWAAGEARASSVVRRFGTRIEEADERSVRAKDVSSPGTALAVARDAVRGWVRIDLTAGSWREDRDFDHLDRYALSLANPSAEPRVLRPLFARDEPSPGVTGMVPMLRDAAGAPTGIPVQLSKNWHRQPDRRLLYEGPWFHGFTMLRLPPRSETRLELSIAYARWGGAPSASHAQLCLVGYGGNQQWDQAAIGSWGESICYDPDVNLNRSMIDDIRPLMVTAMQSREGRWRWTNNVGGGDFLVLLDPDGKRVPLVRMRTAYVSHGPNLTRVVYAGTTADEAIDARIEVSTPRTDDINRAYHRVRYDVRKPVRFSRLAFYQLGADHYNDHRFGMMARGDASGLTEEWRPDTGGKRYHRTGIALTGRAPWVSMHQAVSGDPQGGAWADRGLIVRRWQARLGGKVVGAPRLASFGTDDGVPSANAELGPPPDLTELRPGDFVAADIEIVIVPMSAHDYYGPNEALRQALGADGDTWRMVHREAAGNDLAVRAVRGRLVRRTPVEVRSTDGRGAEVEVANGLGYVPVSFSGLREPTGWTLEWSAGGGWTAIDQSVHGADWWQTEYLHADRAFRVTVNVPLAVLSAGRALRLRLRR